VERKRKRGSAISRMGMVQRNARARTNGRRAFTITRVNRPHGPGACTVNA
jgi:hypothetical protein